MSTPGADPAGLRARILEILAEHRLMSIATVRPDGWPQATVVGYAHDGLSLYFVTPRTSQKVQNIAREPRVSIAIGGEHDRSLRGLSMAALAAEVTDPGEVERLNQLVFARYPEHQVFAPSAASVALIKAAPQIVSVIDYADGERRTELVRLGEGLHA